MMRRIDRWFPDRQVLIRGPDKISALMISQRQQICCAVVAAVCAAWMLGATVGIAASYHAESQAALNAQRLQLAQASNQATIEKITAECVRLAEERDLAVAQADKIRDLAVAEADKMRDDAVARANQIRDQAVAQARLATATNNEITEQLIRQTQATIGHVETIIKSTGLDPDQLARLPGPAPGGPAAGGPAAGGPAPGAPDREAVAPTDVSQFAALDPSTPDLSAELSHSNMLSQEISRLQSLGNVLQQMPLIAPVAEVSISSPFGYRPDPWTGVREFHVGIDIRGAIGSPVYATAPGVVTFAGVSTGYGNLVVIDHGYGLTTRYSHLQKILVQIGAAVTEHQEIGLLGNTGWSTGPHLLYETRVDGQPQNPLNFIKATP